jgi:DHA2 family multidrug resistance protein
MISLALAGWLMRRFDSRLVIAFGFVNVAFSAYLFSKFTLDVGVAEFIFAIFFNGAGVGLIFVPLTAISFITLPPHLRTEGSTLTSLFRVYGAGIGISVMVSVLSRTSVIAHAELTEAVNPYNPLMRAPFLPEHWNIFTDTGRFALEQEISRQASSIGFLNDFNLLFWGALISIPMLLLLRNKAPA